MEQETNDAIEKLKKAVAEFSVMFPSWRPKAKDPNLDNMIYHLQSFPLPNKNSLSLLEKLILIRNTFNSTPLH